jgi:hypothetical protein
MYFNVSYAIHTDINLIVQLINIFIMKNLPKTFLGALALACISLASCSSDEPMQQKKVMKVDLMKITSLFQKLYKMRIANLH